MNIDFKTLMFLAFAVVLIIAALGVITARNPVHAALFLVLSFFSAAAIWMLLKAEFLSIALVLVYVGAVMVLFMFVVMMLDINLDKLREGFWSYLPLAAIIGFIIVVEMASVLIKTFLIPDASVPPAPAGTINTKVLGKLIFTDYVYAFEIAAVILLVAIIAAVALTLRQRKDTKAQNPGKQIAVRRADRVRMVSMKASEKQ